MLFFKSMTWRSRYTYQVIKKKKKVKDILHNKYTRGYLKKKKKSGNALQHKTITYTLAYLLYFKNSSIMFTKFMMHKTFSYGNFHIFTPF